MWAGNYPHKMVPFCYTPKSNGSDIKFRREIFLSLVVTTYIFMRCFNAQSAQLQYLFIPKTKVCKVNKYDFKNCLNMYLPGRLISWVNYMDFGSPP